MKYTCGPVTGPPARTPAPPRVVAEAHHERLADGLEVGLVPAGSVERQDGGDVETRGVLERGEAGDASASPPVRA